MGTCSGGGRLLLLLFPSSINVNRTRALPHPPIHPPLSSRLCAGQRGGHQPMSVRPSIHFIPFPLFHIGTAAAAAVANALLYSKEQDFIPPFSPYSHAAVAATDNGDDAR